ncbi:hypothetical protein OTK59_12255 [Vibrio natriegens]|uniref:hypothetical protein n=1 Tax=Vibrio natriegens TaxID=691 RepID=UPI002284131F|nr:hypothetical protein [Vibrio natriegens]MCY9877329.1 hypothetical protein [Vibrio natriegens]
MKIKVEKTYCDSDAARVEFSSDYGRSAAIWVGEAPVTGCLYDVELDVDDDLVWGESISTTSRSTAAISLEEELFVVVGKVISLEEDGCVSISVGDSVILLDVENAPNGLSGLIECRASDVKLYPTNL